VLVKRLLTATALATIFTGALFTGTANASTVLSQGCTGSVIGNMGDQVAVLGKDVSDLVKVGAKEQEIFLHLNGVDPDKLAQEITNKGALAVGQVPNTANGSITGAAVAATVGQALRNADGLGWPWDNAQKQKTLDAITKKVAGNCGLTLYAGNYSPATTSPSTPNGASPTARDLVGGMTGTGTAIAPPRDYGNIPVAVPGIAAAPGEKYPTIGSAPAAPAPETGVISGGSTEQQPNDVRNAGHASALTGGDPAPNTVQLPMLLAVVALAGVSAALVRTWVLRKLS